MRIFTILLLVLAAPALAAGTGYRSDFARLAYARAPAFLATLDTAPAKSYGRRANHGRPSGLRILTVAAAAHLADCAAMLHAADPMGSVARAQLLAAKFIPGARLPDDAKATGPTDIPADVETVTSAELVPSRGMLESVEPETPIALASRGRTLEEIATAMPPPAAPIVRASRLKRVDTQTPRLEIPIRGGTTVAVAEASPRAVEEVALFAPVETVAYEDAAPERVAAVTLPARAAAVDTDSSPHRSARTKSQHKSASRTAKTRRVAQRARAKARRPKPPVVVTYAEAYIETYPEPDRGTIPASAAKMYDANWQKNAFVYQ